MARLLTPLFALCCAVYLLTAPGRIPFPDDEIVFQTTEAFATRGDASIAGIARRTGEPKGRPDGTFGWAPGRDGGRYSFFGNALAVIALPMHWIASASEDHVPKTWRHAVRSDHVAFHRRTPHADWTRLVVSLTNVWVTALAVVVLGLWLHTLGIGRRAAVATAATYAFATTAWPYSSTFLSEPLSALMLLLAAWLVARYHVTQADGVASTSREPAAWLASAAFVCGLAVHAHILNVIMAPAFVGYAALGGVRRPNRGEWVSLVVAGTIGPATLGLLQFVRFGNPLETGRFGHYSRFVAPWKALAAFVYAPGRSFALFSPVVLGGWLGWRSASRRVRIAMCFGLSLLLLRALFVATRSDWWGGWALGPRYLVPAVPFCLVGLATGFDRWRQVGRRTQLGIAAFVALSVSVQLRPATRSIFEWMVHVHRGGRIDGRRYLTRSHWDWDANPLVGMGQLAPDTLWTGAQLLAKHGHTSLRSALYAVAAAGMAAGAVLALRWWAARDASSEQ